MIPRQITTSLKRSLTQFPIVSLTGSSPKREDYVIEERVS